ncbi:MAG: hypothetical protein L6R39_006151 [Caloplaca ligustica]|nr:MAG: hypothetical protein L6R39_006151 [Caloplaca ligustica]
MDGQGPKATLSKRKKMLVEPAVNKNVRPRKDGKRSELQFSHQYLADRAMRAEARDITGRGLVRRAHNDAWTKYVPKRIQNYNEWKNRGVDQDDKVALCDFDKTYDFGVDPLAVTKPFGPIKSYIKGDKGQTYTFPQALAQGTDQASDGHPLEQHQSCGQRHHRLLQRPRRDEEGGEDKS